MIKCSFRASGLVLLISLTTARAAAMPTDSVALDASSGISWAVGTPRTEDTLRRDWGQFEFRVQRDRFPIPTPRCHGSVVVRLIALIPTEAARDTKLKERWALLQALRALPQSGAKVQVDLDLRHYTERSKQGVAPKSCNAFATGGRIASDTAGPQGDGR